MPIVYSWESTIIEAVEWFRNILLSGAMPDKGDYSKDSARKLLAAWNHLVQIMIRENNMTDTLGIESIDWQIGNWANDTSMVAHNAHLYEDEIRVNEQILQIRWDD